MQHLVLGILFLLISMILIVSAIIALANGAKSNNKELSSNGIVRHESRAEIIMLIVGIATLILSAIHFMRLVV